MRRVVGVLGHVDSVLNHFVRFRATWPKTKRVIVKTNFDPLRDDVANGVECEVLRGTTTWDWQLLAPPPVSEID